MSRSKKGTTPILSGFDIMNAENGGMNGNGESQAVKSKKEKKVKFQLLLNKLQKTIVLKESQQVFSKKIEENTITFATGPAGTSKTFSACYTLLKLLFEGKIERVVFTKPIKESGENLGFLPGGIDDKLQPYMESFIYTCGEMIGEEAVKFLLDHKFIENRPLAYMRGISLNKCGLFLDEAQSSLAEQLILYITRLGRDSKMVICGDITQSDIAKKLVVFDQFINLIKDVKSVALHQFKREDIVRHEILIEITDRYEKWKEVREMESEKKPSVKRA